jgi:secondary thiamine-phosphate synthase enzyme
MHVLKPALYQESGLFHSHHENIRFRTARRLEFRDITDDIYDAVQRSGIRTGTVNVQSRHTTATVLINENEPLLLKDLKQTLERIAPRRGKYRHDDFTIRTVNMEPDEKPNGHAHCKSLFLRASETLNLHDGILQIGRWQRMFFVELDRSRDRSISVLIMGIR